MHVKGSAQCRVLRAQQPLVVITVSSIVTLQTPYSLLKEVGGVAVSAHRWVPCGASAWGDGLEPPVSLFLLPMPPAGQLPNTAATLLLGRGLSTRRRNAAGQHVHVLFTSEVLRPREVRGLAVLMPFVRGGTSCIFIVNWSPWAPSLQVIRHA